MKIGSVSLESPFVVAPMAGMTDTAFRRLVKRHGGCGLVVTEMVSSEGLVRGIDRTLEYAEYTEEERPVSIQIFGGDPEKMADAAQIVEGLGANIVDVNMGCPVPKIAKHNAGCSLMREPQHAAAVIAAMTKRVKIPVTVKMRAGWNEQSINAPELAKRVEAAGASAVAVHGRTAAQSYSGHSDWSLIDRVAESVRIPVLGSGDCIEPEDVVARMRTGVRGVLVGRGVLRNPWILAQAADLAAGRPAREVTLEDRGRFLIEYMDLLLSGDVGEATGFRHRAGQVERPIPDPHALNDRARHERWVINKLRALMSWYSKGLHNGGHLRTAINSAASTSHAREIIEQFFALNASVAHHALPPTLLVSRPKTLRFLSAVVLASGMTAATSCGGATEQERVQASYDKTTGKLSQLTVDAAKNGKPDIYSYMDGTKFIRIEIDKDEDGKIDRWEYYGADQKLERVGFSRANDGEVDAWAFQTSDGSVARIEVSTKRDGKPNRTEFYDKNLLTRAEEDTDGDARIDKWEQYESGALVSVSFDTTKSGKPTTTVDYRK